MRTKSKNHRRSRPARYRAALVAIAATAAVAPGVAHAGEYQMNNCNVPGTSTGHRGPWVINPNTAATRLYAFDSCASGGSFGFNTDPGTAEMNPNSIGSVYLAKPGGVTITGLTSWMTTNTREWTATQGSPAYQLTYVDGGMTHQWGPGLMADYAFVNDVQPSSLFEFSIFCGNNAAKPCYVGFPGEAPVLGIKGTRVTLAEYGAPSASLNGGTLTTAGYKKGNETVAAKGTDATSGVEKLEVLLGNDVVGTIDYRRNWAVGIGSQKTSTCRYDDWNACPGSQTNEFTVNTRAVADGVYALKVRATDAAQNVDTAQQTVTIDNTAPVRPNATSPRTATVNAASATVTWANPAGQVAPIAKAHVKVCGPKGCSETVIDATGTSAKVDLPDGHGDYTVAVALEDAAGNYDATQRETWNVRFAPAAEAPATVVPVAPTTPGPAGPSGPAGADGGNGNPGAHGARGATTVTVTANGAGATAQATLKSAFVGHQNRTIRSAYGKKVLITGQLVAPGGKPITGAKLTVLHKDKLVGAEMVPVGEVVTDAKGKFAYATVASRSRTIRFGYRANLEDVDFSKTSDVGLGVIARLSLKPSKKTLRNGQTVRFTGTVAGAPKNVRKVVELQVKQGKRWMTFRSTRLRNGKFQDSYRFTRTRGVKTYVFRARVRAEAGFPFETGHSRQVKVKVRG